MRTFAILPSTPIQEYLTSGSHLCPVLIIGYERVRSSDTNERSANAPNASSFVRAWPYVPHRPFQFRQDWETLAGSNFGLVVCDEGHRIKNANIKTAQARRGRAVWWPGARCSRSCSRFFLAGRGAAAEPPSHFDQAPRHSVRHADPSTCSTFATHAFTRILRAQASL